MISKELLSEVLLIKIFNINYLGDSMLAYNTYNPTEKYSPCHREKCERGLINIYELAHKCKELAFNLGYKVVSFKHSKETYIVKVYKDDEEIYFSTEHTQYECDINACQWIYENIKRIKKN